MSASRAIAVGPAPLTTADALLDRAGLRARVAPLLEAEGLEIRAVEPYYLRGKPGVSALLGVRVAWASAKGAGELLASLYLAEPARVAESLAKLGTRRIEPAPAGAAFARGPWLDQDSRSAAIEMLYLAFPNDRELRGLSAIAVPRRLKNRLQGAAGFGSGDRLKVRERRSRVEVVRWKPARRAVLLATLGLRDEATGARDERQLYLRGMPAESFGRSLAAWRRAATLGLVVPQIEAADEALQWFAVSALAGTPRFETNGGSPPLDASLGVALAPLYAGPLAADGTPPCSDEGDWEVARQALEAVARWWPERGAEAHEISARLRANLRGLRPIVPRPRHGDLTADQILSHAGSPAFLDWDEMGDGDPHADLANLAVQLALHRHTTLEAEGLERAARAALGTGFDGDRLRHHVDLAWARHALSGLQAGALDWRERAARVLAALEPIRAGRLAGFGAERLASTAHAPSSRTVLGAGLRGLLDPTRRLTMTAGTMQGPRLIAVWPDRDGAIARLEPGPRFSRAGRWVRMSPEPSILEPDHDAALPSFGRRSREPGTRLLAHRVGCRALFAIQARPDRLLALRPPSGVDRFAERLRIVSAALAGAGLAAPEILGREDTDGVWLSRLAGESMEPGQPSASLLTAMGIVMARIRALAPAGLPVRGAEHALAAATRQCDLVECADPELGGRLVQRLEHAWRRARALGVSAPTSEDGSMLVHGDLHPAQWLVRDGAPVLLDWEQAHLGQPEEDLGNFAAELEWWFGSGWETAWSCLLEGYLAAGGRANLNHTLWWRDVARVRILAVHSWRDGKRARVRTALASLPSWEGEDT